VVTFEIQQGKNDESVIVLMTETVSTSETSVTVYRTTRRNIPEDTDLHTRKRLSWLVVNTPASYSGGPDFKSRPEDRLS
jgi:hypothetical protein